MKPSFSINSLATGLDLEAEKKARLIAAAPELLDALSAILKAWESGSGGDFWRNEIGNARTAIIKATGANHV